jgi:hypothetical protein
VPPQGGGLNIRPKKKARRPLPGPPNFPTYVPRHPGQVKVTPIRAPSARVVRQQAHRQEQQYRAQGRAVRRAAATQRVLGPGHVVRVPHGKSLTPARLRAAKRELQRANFRDIGGGDFSGKPHGLSGLLHAISHAVGSGEHQLEANVPLVGGIGAGVRGAIADLTGKGAIPQTAPKIARAITHKGPLAWDLKFNSALARHTPVLGKAIKAGTVPDPGKLTGRAIQDFLNVPAQAIPSAYAVTAGSYEALHGRPQRLKQIHKQLDTSDPGYNTGAAVIDALAGDTKGAAGRLHTAKKAAIAHPGIAVMEAVGARGAIGRGTSAGFRGAGRVTGSDRVYDIGSTHRAPKTLPGTDIVQRQRYSKDLLKKAVEKKRERDAQRKTNELRAQAKAEPDPTKRADLHRQARQHDPHIIRDAEIRRQVDEHQSMTEHVRRINRSTVLKREGKTTKAVAKAGPVAALLVQRIARAHIDDLVRYQHELEIAHGRLLTETPRPKAKLQANEQLRHDLGKAIEKIRSGKVDLAEVKRQADEYAVRSRQSQQGLIERGMLAPTQAPRAALVPFAARELGAHRDQPYLAEQARVAKKAAQKAAGAARRAKQKPGRIRTNEPFGPLTKPAAARLTKAEQTVVRRRSEAEAAKAAARGAKKLARRGKDPLLVHDVRTEQVPAVKPKIDTTDRAQRIQFKPNSRPFKDNQGKRHFEPGRGAIDANGKLHTWYEGGQTHAEMGFHPGNSGTFMIGPDGTIRVHNGSDKMGGQEITARAIAQDSRLKSEMDPNGRAIDGTGKTYASVNDHLKRVSKEYGRAKPATTREVPIKRPLSDAEIHAALAKHGEQLPGFLSQRPGQRSASAYYVNAGKPPTIGSAGRREGTAALEGTFDAHPELLHEQAVRTQGLMDAFDHFQQFIRSFGLHKPDGSGVHSFKGFKEARQAAADRSAQGDVQWVPVRINPFPGTKAQLQKMLEGTAPDTALHQKLVDALDENRQGASQEGPWAVVPRAAAKRQMEHLGQATPTDAARVVRMANSAMRKTVLATSIPWLAGNVSEATLRLAMERAGVGSLITGRKALAEAKRQAEAQGKPELYQDALARTVGGGHYGYVESQHIHTALDQFGEGHLKDIGRLLGTFWRKPGPKQAAEVWNRYTHFIFQNVNHFVEQQYQTAMLGKAVKNRVSDMPLRNRKLLGDRLLGLSQKATEEAGRGLLDRGTAIQLGRELDTMYGKYGKFSPTERRLLALYTPFGAWAKNAAQYVYWTLPREHPLALAAGALANQATADWRKAHGLDLFMGTGALPAFLQGSIPGAGATKYRAPTRYTPFGLSADIGGTLAGQVMPLLSGPLQALRGQDWKGAKLKSEDPITEGKAGALALLTATVPALGLGLRVGQKGPKAALLDSAIGKTTPKKKGSQASAPFSPFSGSSSGPPGSTAPF